MIQAWTPETGAASQDKWLDDLMMSRLWVDLEGKGMINSWQYGFTAGQGTNDAINCLIDEQMMRYETPSTITEYPARSPAHASIRCYKR